MNLTKSIIGTAFLILLTLTSCSNSEENKVKELELKQKELELKEREISLKEKNFNKERKVTTQQLEQTTNKTKKELVYLYTSNGGMVGYFSDGSVVGCPRCDFCKSNVLAMFKEKPMGSWDLVKPDDFVSYEEDYGWVLIDYKWNKKVPQN